LGLILHDDGADMLRVSVVPGILRTPLTLPIPSITYPYVSLIVHEAVPSSVTFQYTSLVNCAGTVAVILWVITAVPVIVLVVVFTTSGTILVPKA